MSGEMAEESKLAWKHNQLIGSVMMARAAMLSIKHSPTTTVVQHMIADLALEQLEKLRDQMQRVRLDASGRQVVRKPKTRKTK